MLIKSSGEKICTNDDCESEDDFFEECHSCGRETYPASFDENNYCRNCQSYYSVVDYL